jgi:hypothetical protein
VVETQKEKIEAERKTEKKTEENSEINQQSQQINKPAFNLKNLGNK